MRKESTYKSFDDLPVVLQVQTVADVLGIGRAHAYQLVREPGFPSILIGSRIVVHRDKFIEWINKKAEENINLQ